MLRKYPQIPYSRAIAVLERLGFTQVRGSQTHIILIKPHRTGNLRCIVPRESPLSKASVKQIMAQSEIDPLEFLAQLRLLP